MTTGMTYQLLHSPLTARNSCIVSFQWLFTVLKDKKWCSTHSKFIAFTSSGLTGSIVVRQPSRRRCPEEWLHLNLCSLSVFSANANRSAAPMIKRGYKLVDWQHYSLTMVATTIMMEERQLFRFPGQRTSSYFQGLVRLHSAETTPRYNHAKCGRGNQWEGLLDGTEDDGRESMVEHCSVLGHKWLSTSLATHRYRLIMIPFRPAFMTAPSSPTPFTPTTPPATNII